MAAQTLVLEEMTAEELLAEMVRQDAPHPQRERVRERIVEMHRPLAMETDRSPWRSPGATATAESPWKISSRRPTSA
jgi:hypothetical protein